MPACLGSDVIMHKISPGSRRTFKILPGEKETKRETKFSSTTTMWRPSVVALFLSVPFKKHLGTSLVTQWLRVCLPMQGLRVQSLIGELGPHVLNGN